MEYDDGPCLVEAEVRAQLRALYRGRILTEQIGHRVADILKEHECDKRHREHHDHGLGKTAKDEGEHASVGARRRI